MDATALILTIIAAALATIGIIFAIVFYFKNKKRQKAPYDFGWDRIRNSANQLGGDIKAIFKPDIFFSISPRSGIIAILIRNVIDMQIPLFIGLTFFKKHGSHIPINDHYLLVPTEKMEIYVPKALELYRGQKILIVDEYSMTGETLHILKKAFFKMGFEEENVKTAALIEAEGARKGRKSADFVSEKIGVTDFDMPWGAAD